MPLAWSDSRAAWLGAVAGRPDTSERIEAAAYRGKPIYFDVIYPWSKPERSAPSIPTPHERIANIIGVTLFFALALSGVFVTRRNFHLNRADTRGATRLGTFVLLSYLAMWLLRAHHLASIEEFFQFLVALSWGLLATALVTVMYLALEPFVRRREPHTLIPGAGCWPGNSATRSSAGIPHRGIIRGLAHALRRSRQFYSPAVRQAADLPGTLSPDSLLGIHHAMGMCSSPSSFLFYTA